jgi:hypothetical protein
MRAMSRHVTLRIDRDVIEVSALGAGGIRQEFRPFGDTADAFAALEAALCSSRLLRPGRACRLRVLIESERAVYVVPEVVQGDHGPLLVSIPPDLLSRIESTLLRRRIHGPVSLEVGPLARLAKTLSGGVLAADGREGPQLLIDRSSAAVTVVELHGHRVRRIRGAQAADPQRAIAGLLGPVWRGSHRRPFARWLLDDVTVLPGRPDRVERARCFEDACAALLGGIPRSQGVL